MSLLSRLRNHCLQSGFVPLSAFSASVILCVQLWIAINATVASIRRASSPLFIVPLVLAGACLLWRFGLFPAWQLFYGARAGSLGVAQPCLASAFRGLPYPSAPRAPHIIKLIASTDCLPIATAILLELVGRACALSNIGRPLYVLQKLLNEA
eukprot:3374886-Pleurochrysis_carterae.AAC.2